MKYRIGNFYITIHNPSNSHFQHWNIEVDNETHSHLRELQICQKLSLMNRENFLNRFQFEHNAILNKQVHSISTI